MATFYKTPNNFQFCKWEVVSGSGQFTMISKRIANGGAKNIQMNFFSGSITSEPPVGNAIINTANKFIVNPNLEIITEAEYNTALEELFTSLKNGFPTE